MYNAVEDYKYTISFEVDYKKLESQMNKALKNSMRLVKDFESRVYKSITNIHKFQGKKYRQSYETQIKFAAKGQKTAYKLERELLDKRLEQYHNFYREASKLAKDHNKTMNTNIARVGKGGNATLNKANGGFLDRAVNTMVRGAFYRLGAGVVSSLGTAFHEAIDIDLLIRQIKMKSSGNGYQPKYENIKNEISSIGNSTIFTNSEVAHAMELGATLGLKQELGQITRLAANFAQAANKDLPESLEKITMMFNSFGIKGEKAREEFIDKVFYISNNSAAELTRIFEGMKQFAPIGKQAGLSSNQIMALLGTLNNIGITGSQAGTSLQAMVNNLTNSKKRQKTEELLGRTIADDKGNLDVRAVIAGLVEKMRGVNNVDKLAIMQDLFNIRGAKAMNSLTFDKALFDYDKLMSGLNSSQGGVNKAVVEQNAGIGGQYKLMASKISDTFQQLIGALAPIILPTLKVIQGLATSFKTLIKAFSPLINLAVVFMGVLLAKASWSLILKTLVLMKSEFNIILGLVKGLFTATGLFKLMLLGIVLALVKVANFYIDIINKNETLKNTMNDIFNILSEIGKNILGVFIDLFNAIFGININLDETTTNTENIKTTLEIIRDVLNTINEKILAFREFITTNETLIKIIATLYIVVKVIGFIISSAKALGAIWAFFVNASIFISKFGTILTTIAGIVKGALVFGLGAIKGVLIFILGIVKSVIGFLIANPIVLIIMLIVGALILVWKHWDTIKSVMISIYDKIKILGNAMLEVGKTIWEAIVSPFKTGYEWVASMIDKVKSFVGLSTTATPKKFEVQHNAMGTNNFKGGLTTVDERGDEAIWLPSGSLIANNTTTRDMLAQLKSINHNQQLRSGKGNITIENIVLNVSSNDGRAVAQELLNEISNFAYQ